MVQCPSSLAEQNSSDESHESRGVSQMENTLKLPSALAGGQVDL